MGGIIFAVVVLILFFGMMSANGKKKEKQFKEIADTYTKPMLLSVFPNMEYEYNRRFEMVDYKNANFFSLTDASGHDYVKTLYLDIPVEFNVTTLAFEENDSEGPSYSSIVFQGPWFIIKKGYLHSGRITVIPGDETKKSIFGKTKGPDPVMTGDPVFDGTFSVYGDESAVRVFLDKTRRDKLVKISKKHTNVYFSFETDKIQVAYGVGNILFKPRKKADLKTVFSSQLNDLLDLMNDAVQL